MSENDGQSPSDQNLATELEDSQALNQDLQVGIEKRKEKLRIEKEILEQMNLQFQASRKQTKFNNELLANLERQAGTLAKMKKEEEQGIITAEKYAEQMDKVVTYFKEAEKSGALTEEKQKEIAKLLKEGTVESTRELAKLTGQVRGVSDNLADTQDKIANRTKSFAKSLGMAANFAETGFGKFQLAMKDLASGDADGKANSLVKSFKEMTSPMNIVASLFDVIVTQAFALEQASISFSKATGFAREFDNQIVTVAKNINMAGGSMKDASQSLGDLAKNMSFFGQMTETAMKSLATLNFRLKNIGVSNASKLFDIFNRNMRAGADETSRLTRELILSGTAAGITAGEMSAGFESSFKRLALEGGRAVESFKDLAAQAKAAGVAVSDLMAMTKDFDTFSAGAEKAAKLNAILGTQISHMRMLNMSDEQRSREMIRQIKSRVGDFDALTRSEKLYIAQAIAGGDVAKAQRMINMSTSEYLAKKDKMAAAAKTQEEMQKLTEALVPAVDKLKLAFTQVALELAPLIELLVKGLNLLSKMSPVIMGLVAGYAFYAIGIAAVNILTKIGIMIQSRELLLAPIRLMMAGKIGAKLMFQALAQNILNMSMARGTVLLLAMAFAVAFVMYQMTVTRSPPFYAIFFVVAAGIKLFGKALSTMGPKAMLAGLVLALLAGAISLIFYGIGYLVEQMVAFVTVIAAAPLVFYNAAGGIYTLAGAMGALTLSTIGFRFDAFTNFANSIGNLGAGMEAYASGIKKLKSAAGDLSAAMGNNTMIGSVEGGKSTVVLGKNAAIASVFSSDKLVIDVQMPEINFPTPIVNVYIDGVAISDSVMDVIMETR